MALDGLKAYIIVSAKGKILAHSDDLTEVGRWADAIALAEDEPVTVFETGQTHVPRGFSPDDEEKPVPAIGKGGKPVKATLASLARDEAKGLAARALADVHAALTGKPAKAAPVTAFEPDFPPTFSPSPGTPTPEPVISPAPVRPRKPTAPSEQ